MLVAQNVLMIVLVVVFAILEQLLETINQIIHLNRWWGLNSVMLQLWTICCCLLSLLFYFMLLYGY